MATTDVVGVILQKMRPRSDEAGYTAYSGIVQGGSTPNELVGYDRFDEGVDKYVDFLVKINGYGATTGLTIQLLWSAESATTGNVYWATSFRRLPLDAEDINASHTYTFEEAADAAPSVVGEVVQHAEVMAKADDGMDSVVEDDICILRVRRTGTNALDTMAGAAFLHAVIVTET